MCREMIQQRVIQAYEEEKARAKLPGYVPNYDDLDDDVSWTPQAGHVNAEASKLEGAERPRGPHRAPAAPPRTARPETRINDGFGGGIFE